MCFPLAVKDEGFRNIVGGGYHISFFLRVGEIFSCGGRHGGIVSIKYADDVRDAYVFLVSDVEIHGM